MSTYLFSSMQVRKTAKLTESIEVDLMLRDGTTHVEETHAESYLFAVAYAIDHLTEDTEYTVDDVVSIRVQLTNDRTIL